MIKLSKGNILESKVDALVNTVNCVGVMGKGIALQFRQAFPENYDLYKAACNKKEVVTGKMFTVELPVLQSPKYIINFPTKYHWREKSKIEYIDSGLEDLVKVINEYQIKSIAIPPLGCGLGGLDWNVVRPKIESALNQIDELNVELFEPIPNSVQVSTVNRTQRPNMTPGRAVLLLLMQRYLSGFMDPFVSLLEIHKLMYFMQEAGEPLKLKYKKAHYGPYAQNLRQVLIRLDEHFISGYGEGEDNPRKPITLIQSALPEANSLLKDNYKLQIRLNRVQRLIDGFESPIGMELLATVHWIYKNHNPKDLDEVINYVHNWNNRKKEIFTKNNIKVAWENLEGQGWLAFS